MAACPHCQFANPDEAFVCGRCGRQFVGTPGNEIAVPLPARMTEPICPLPKPPTDDRPLVGQLGSKSVVVTSAPVPSARSAVVAPATLRDSPVDEFLTHDGIPPGGTVPAHPGLPGHPMNDAVLQSPPQSAPATDPAEAGPLSNGPTGKPKLVVLRGLKINLEYPIYEGRNTIGRFADKPVDIDLVNQEAIEQIWCSRQHAVVTFDRGIVMVEDMNSLNGTWVNGTRLHTGHYKTLQHGDVTQVGTVQLKLVIG
jgi:FHA domain-containing protein